MVTMKKRIVLIVSILTIGLFIRGTLALIKFSITTFILSSFCRIYSFIAFAALIWPAPN